MPQISLPDIRLKDIGERLQDVRDDAHLPDDLRDRLSDAGDRISDVSSRIGEEVGDRISDIRWSDLKLPALTVPKNIRREIARFEVPQVTIGKPKSGTPVLPFVVLAAVAGVFVGWWLATSEFASARVRSAIDQTRVRLGLAHDWDETVEERTEEFWSDERGWRTGGQPDGDQPSTEPMRPSSSMDGDGDPMREESAGSSISGEEVSAASSSATTSGWPQNRYGNPGDAPDSLGGTGYEPDTER